MKEENKEVYFFNEFEVPSKPGSPYNALKIRKHSFLVPCSVIFCEGDKREKIRGNFEICIYDQEKFGREIGFNFVWKKDAQVQISKRNITPRTLEFNNVEVYLPEKEGLEFLKLLVEKEGDC